MLRVFIFTWFWDVTMRLDRHRSMFCPCVDLTELLSESSDLYLLYSFNSCGFYWENVLMN